jgi:outer membrane receptor protein involved in Fe transport
LSQGFHGAPGVVGDPSLEPMRGWSKEMGARYEGTFGSAQLAFFRLDVSHERILNPVTREVIPTGKSVRQGINFDAELRLGSRLRLMADGTLNDARIKGDSGTALNPVVVPDLAIGPGGKPIRPSFHIEPLEPGDPVPNVANWLGRVGLEAALSPRFSTRGMVRVSGPYTPIGEPGVQTHSYSVLDLGASLQLSRMGATLDLELQNVLGTKYPEIRASGFINPGAPRTLRAALRFAEQQ